MNSRTLKFHRTIAQSNKKLGDIIAVSEMNLIEQRSKRLKNNGIERLEELKEQGNIREAAVVFSREGVEVFTNLLMNSIESKINKIVSNLLIETMQGILEGISQIAVSKENVIQTTLEQVVDEQQRNTLSLITTPNTESNTESKNDDNKKLGTRSLTNRKPTRKKRQSITHDYTKIMQEIKTIPNPFRSSVLEKHLKELGIYKGDNISNVLRHLVDNGHVTKIDYGIYTIKEQE